MSSIEDAAAAMVDLIVHPNVMANVGANGRLTVTFDRTHAKDVARVCLGHRGVYDTSPWGFLHG
jgi:hypothetical protein